MRPLNHLRSMFRMRYNPPPHDALDVKIPWLRRFPSSFMTPSSLELQTRREAGYLKSAATLSMSLTVLSDQTSGSCFRAFVVTNCG